MAWQEEQPWRTNGAATDVLGFFRLLVYNMLGLLKARYLRTVRYRRLTLASFVAWLEQVSVWAKADAAAAGSCKYLRNRSPWAGVLESGPTIDLRQPFPIRSSLSIELPGHSPKPADVTASQRCSSLGRSGLSRNSVDQPGQRRSATYPIRPRRLHHRES